MKMSTFSLYKHFYNQSNVVIEYYNAKLKKQSRKTGEKTSYPPLHGGEWGMYTMQTVLDLDTENSIHPCGVRCLCFGA